MVSARKGMQQDLTYQVQQLGLGRFVCQVTITFYGHYSMSISRKLSTARAWVLPSSSWAQFNQVHYVPQLARVLTIEIICFDMIYYSTEQKLLTEDKIPENEHGKHFKVFKKCEESCRFTQNQMPVISREKQRVSYRISFQQVKQCLNGEQARYKILASTQ